MSRRSPRARHWVEWLVCNGVGAGLAGLLLSFSPGAGILLFGAILAIPQWLLLRSDQGSPRWWVLGTGATWAGVMLLLLQSPSWLVRLGVVGLAPFVLPIAVLAAPLAGFAVGAVQARALGVTAVAAHQWTLGSTLGGVLVVPIGVLLFLSTALREYGAAPAPTGALVIAALGGVLYALPTGGLVRVIRERDLDRHKQGKLGNTQGGGDVHVTRLA